MRAAPYPEGNPRRDDMTAPRPGWIANYIWSIADDVLRDVYVCGKYRDVVLPAESRTAPFTSWNEP